jgi:MFS transporter, NRE family, putaive nickel resistance protein
MTNIFAPFRSLRNPAFARLYISQATSLLGDALTWVGLALLAYKLAGSNASVILGAALTLRVTAFVILSPLAGALADRLDRKLILVSSDLGRMVVIGLMPFVTQAWQVYVLMFALNSFTAFFTPTYQATIPLVTGKDDYGQAISLSGATYEVLGVLGPGIAGAVAVFLSARSIFFLDAATFLISALLILTLPRSLNAARETLASYPFCAFRSACHNVGGAARKFCWGHTTCGILVAGWRGSELGEPADASFDC